MPVTLFLADSQIYRNRALVDALKRKIEAGAREIGSIHYLHLPSDEKSLSDVLTEGFERSSDLCIAAAPDTFALIRQILRERKSSTTGTEGSADSSEETSLLLKLNDLDCNLLLLRSGEEIPQIKLAPGKRESVWQFFGSEEELHTLYALARERGVAFDFFEEIEGWYRLHTRERYSLERLLPSSSDCLLFPSENIFDSCIALFGERGERITFAESCTGGLIASSFTARAGSSALLDGSVISYANRIKSGWLNVDEKILEKYGAVSRECVKAMAEGARLLARSEIALATSGIAGPTGGTDLKPIGTVYIAVSSSEGTETLHLRLKGDRNYIQYQAMMHVLRLMIEQKKEIFKKFFKNS